MSTSSKLDTNATKAWSTRVKGVVPANRSLSWGPSTALKSPTRMRGRLTEDRKAGTTTRKRRSAPHEKLFRTGSRGKQRRHVAVGSILGGRSGHKQNGGRLDGDVWQLNFLFQLYWGQEPRKVKNVILWWDKKRRQPPGGWPRHISVFRQKNTHTKQKLISTWEKLEDVF